MLPTLSEKIISNNNNINLNIQDNQNDKNNQTNKIKTHQRSFEVLIDCNNDQINNNQNNFISFGQKEIEGNENENNNKFGASNNIIINNEINQNTNAINFGAPKDNNTINYTPLSTNFTFGFKKNENANIYNNDNDLNVSSSIDKSSEINEFNTNVKFGFVETNNENIITLKKNNPKLKLDSNNVKFGFVDNI